MNSYRRLATSRGESPDLLKIFLSNMPGSADETELRSVFRQWGEVSHVAIPRNRVSKYQ
jgi:RNA recognition motif-containing protein